MRFRTLSVTLLVSALALTACDSDNATGVVNTATVQFINATSTSLDVTANGAVAAGGSALAYGVSSTCMSVDPTSSGLAVRTTGTSTVLPNFTPAFTAGGSYTVVAYVGAAGTMQFVTLSNAFTPGSGQAGLRVVNVGPVGSSYDVYVSAPGAAAGTPSVSNVGVGTASSYFNVTGTSARHVSIMNAATQIVVADLGSSNTFTAGKRSTLVITPFGTGTTSPRAFFIVDC
jgi:hypothetical protein